MGDIPWRAFLCQKVQGCRQKSFAADGQVRIVEEFQRVGEGAFDGVSHGYHPITGAAPFDIAEYVLKARQRLQRGVVAEMLQGGIVGQGRFGTQKGDGAGTLDLPGDADDLHEQVMEVVGFQGPPVLPVEAVEDLTLPGSVLDLKPLHALDLADLLGGGQPPVDQVEQLGVDGVDDRTQIGDAGVLAVAFLAHGRGVRPFGSGPRGRAVRPIDKKTAGAWAARGSVFRTLSFSQETPGSLLRFRGWEYRYSSMVNRMDGSSPDPKRCVVM